MFMSKEVADIWRSSVLPYDVRRRIIAEIDMLMYDDDPISLRDDEASTRRMFDDLRYLSIISPREHCDLIAYLTDTVATRLHQLKPAKDIPDPVNRCVCCGAVIPEGGQVCFICKNEKE